MAGHGRSSHLTICVLFRKTLRLETSAHAITFAILLLALYPGVQRNLFKEVVELWPKGSPNSVTVSVGNVNRLSV